MYDTTDMTCDTTHPSVFAHNLSLKSVAVTLMGTLELL